MSFFYICPSLSWLRKREDQSAISEFALIEDDDRELRDQN